jgi:hypothetical protein
MILPHQHLYWFGLESEGLKDHQVSTEVEIFGKT